MRKDLDNKIDFQIGLEIDHKEIAKQRMKEVEDMANTFNKVLMPKIEAIVEWHQESEDRELMANVIREILLGWYMSDNNLANNWIKQEFVTMKANT
tara:strand:+ start:126 stop:413 length:288 start_codon:yes stop_codon:yes gene_type:complete